MYCPSPVVVLLENSQVLKQYIDVHGSTKKRSGRLKREISPLKLGSLLPDSLCVNNLS